MADMTTVDELLAATEADPKSAPIDALSDRYQRLIDARAAMDKAKAEEKEANGELQEYLAEHGASIGLIDGMPVCEMSTGPRRSAPPLKAFDDIAGDMAARNAEIVVELLQKLEVTVKIPLGALVKVLRGAAREVLDSHITTRDVTTLETKKFLPKQK